MGYSNTVSYIKTKRDQFDNCNICGHYGKLTWDHIPPQSCFNNYNIKLNSFFDGLPRTNKYTIQQQDGIKIRSICANCNNKLLGDNYDKELLNIVDTIYKLLYSEISLSTVIPLKFKINKITRSICGHILAIKNYYDTSSLIDKDLRNYFVLPNKMPPKNIKLSIRIYPFSTIIMARDLSIKSYSKIKFPSGVTGVLSAFPLAYILTTGNETCGLSDLFRYCTSDIEQIIEFPLDIKSCFYQNTNVFRDWAWPCNVTDNFDGASFMLMNDKNNSIIANRNLKLTK